MRISKTQLKQIIKEELTSVLAEMPTAADLFSGPPPYAPGAWSPEQFMAKSGVHPDHKPGHPPPKGGTWTRADVLRKLPPGQFISDPRDPGASPQFRKGEFRTLRYGSHMYDVRDLEKYGWPGTRGRPPWANLTTDTDFDIPKSQHRKGAIKKAISNTARIAGLPLVIAASAYDIYTGLRDPNTHLAATFAKDGEEAAFNMWKEQNPDNPNANISYDDYKAAAEEMDVSVLRPHQPAAIPVRSKYSTGKI
tara:strand:+ start:346 stop:1095 length:750 start_codon:yes stop_codon:yes gene_type:complete